MQIINKPISELAPYKQNPRNNEDAVQYVANSISEFGFKVPIVIDKNNVIVAGHTRFKAAQRLGLAEVPVIIADDLSEDQIKAFRLADNKTAELATWDFSLLEKELADLEDAGFDMSEFNFSDEDYEEGGDGGGVGGASGDIEKKPFTGEDGSLARDFVIPPFSIFDTRSGQWITRKKLWRSIIKDDATTRGDAHLWSDNLKAYRGLGKIKKNSLLDPVLAEIIVSWFSPKPENGINVFDNFAGDTVFGFVAGYKGKHFTGIELREEQAKFNEESCAEFALDAHYICDDGRNVRKHLGDETQDLFFSCPPYYDLEVYSDLPNDASNQETYEDFYKILDEAFRNACACLKNNRFAVVVASDMRGKDGGYYDFISDIKKTFTSEGLKLYNEIILVNMIGSGALRSRNAMRNRKVIRLHQEVLVFFKGDQNKINEQFGEVEVAEIESEDEQLEQLDE